MEKKYTVPNLSVEKPLHLC